MPNNKSWKWLSKNHQNAGKNAVLVALKAPGPRASCSSLSPSVRERSELLSLSKCSACCCSPRSVFLSFSFFLGMIVQMQQRCKVALAVTLACCAELWNPNGLDLGAPILVTAFSALATKYRIFFYNTLLYEWFKFSNTFTFWDFFRKCFCAFFECKWMKKGWK